MKKLVFIFLLLSANAYAFDLEVNRFAYPSEGYSSLENDAQIKLRHKFKDIYAFISAESNKLVLVGQPSYDIYLFGAGVGYEFPVRERLYLFGDVGYYHPVYKDGTTEGQRYYMNAQVVGNAEGDGARFWEEYSVTDIDGGFGFVLGAKYRWKRFGVQAGYRHLSLPMMYLGENPSKGMVRHGDNGWWELEDTQDYSGYFVGVSFEF